MPDGDAELSAEARGRVRGGRLPALRRPAQARGGLLRRRRRRADAGRRLELLAEGEVLVVVGSSLTVYSGFRFVRHAHEDR